jgi:hypothetical protein
LSGWRSSCATTSGSMTVPPAATWWIASMNCRTGLTGDQVLAQWGELDRIAVPQESTQIIRQALERGGNPRYTIRLTPGVRHNLNRTTNGGFDRIQSLPPNYGDFEASWIDGLAHGQPAPPASAQPAPHQAQPSRPLAPLAWYESPGSSSPRCCCSGWPSPATR